MASIGNGELNLKTLSISQFQCSFENTRNRTPWSDTDVCQFHKTIHRKLSRTDTKTKVSFSTKNGTFYQSKDTVKILKDIGGGDVIKQMTTRFYARAFNDFTVKKFLFETDGAAAHGERFANWLIEKMGGEGSPWSDSGRFNMRQMSHHKAWSSVNRDKKDRGKRFKLDDCRVWMRLMFWAGREVGLAEHPEFWKWYVAFISHFVQIYESSAPPYGKESADWSKSMTNIEAYEKAGCKMNEVIGIGRY